MKISITRLSVSALIAANLCAELLAAPWEDAFQTKLKSLCGRPTRPETIGDAGFTSARHPDGKSLQGLCLTPDRKLGYFKIFANGEVMTKKVDSEFNLYNGLIRGFYQVNSALDAKGSPHFVMTINHPESTSSNPNPNIYSLDEGQSLYYGIFNDQTSRFRMADLVLLGQGFNHSGNSDRRGYKNPQIIVSEGYRNFAPAVHVAATEQRLVKSRNPQVS